MKRTIHAEFCANWSIGGGARDFGPDPDADAEANVDREGRR